MLWPITWQLQSWKRKITCESRCDNSWTDTSGPHRPLSNLGAASPALRLFGLDPDGQTLRVDAKNQSQNVRAWVKISSTAHTTPFFSQKWHTFWLPQPASHWAATPKRSRVISKAFRHQEHQQITKQLEQLQGDLQTSKSAWWLGCWVRLMQNKSAFSKVYSSRLWLYDCLYFSYGFFGLMPYI